MAVFPVDLHASAGGDVNLTRFRNWDLVHDDVRPAQREALSSIAEKVVRHRDTENGLGFGSR
jgi:hypothetical protein